MLTLDKTTIKFGGLTAVSAFDLTLGRDELVGLIGPNGAGKTTVFNLITGVYQPTDGGISFDGKSLLGRKPHQITANGIARTFQNIRLFPSFSVFDNVRAAFHLRLRGDVRHALWRGRGFSAEEKEIDASVLELLEIFHLGKFRDTPATSLSYGDQRRLEIIRALATRPKLLLLDEPAHSGRRLQHQIRNARLGAESDNGTSIKMPRNFTHGKDHAPQVPDQHE